MLWSGKPYNSFSHFCKSQFSGKTVKIPIESGFTCPNRDGEKGTGGCHFCSEQGSGDFISSYDSYRVMIQKKWPTDMTIPYFQSFSNTYNAIETLERLYFDAAKLPNAVAVSIATRPDCINEDVCKLLVRLRKRIFVFVELGLQSGNDDTKHRMNCLHTNDEYNAATKMLRKAGVNIVSHVILGLPGESKTDMISSAMYAASRSDGIKLQLLHVLRDTVLADMHEKNEFQTLDFDEYIELVIDILCLLPPETVVHRLTGDGDRKKLIAPLWSTDKKRILNELHNRMLVRQIYQGHNYVL